MIIGYLDPWGKVEELFGQCRMLPPLRPGTQ